MNSKEQQKVYEEALFNWLETFKGENVPEEKRILDSQIKMMKGWGVSETDENHQRVTFEFTVTPYSPENTTWNVNGKNLCFAEFDIVDGEYVLKSISETPKNYEEFLESFEEYKQNNENIENTETREFQAEPETNLASEEITKMSHTIFIICFIVFVILLLGIVIRKIKHHIAKCKI